MIDEAVRAAKQAVLVVPVVGWSQGMAHEAIQSYQYHRSRRSARLNHRSRSRGKPLVLVLMNGEPLALAKERSGNLIRFWNWRFCAPGRKAAALVPMCCLAITTRQANFRYLLPVRWDRIPIHATISIRDARIILKSQTNTPHVILTKRMALSIRLVTVELHHIYGV